MLMSGKDQPARLHYMAYSFRMLSPGDHVIEAHVAFIGDGEFSVTYHITVG